MIRRTPWLLARTAHDPPAMRLFCLPHAGGGSSTFFPWRAALPPSIEVCSVLLPGREARFSEPLYEEIDELVDAIDREVRFALDIPFAVFGHSMGALLAFEWVRRLQASGQPMPVWLFLSGRRAPDVPSDAPNLRSLPDREFLNQLANTYQGLAAEFLNNPDMLEVFLPILRADISIVESYAFAPTEPLTCPLTVFAGKDDPTATWEMIRPWSRQTRGPFALQLFPGGHFYPHPPLLQTIGETLRHLPPTA